MHTNLQHCVEAVSFHAVVTSVPVAACRNAQNFLYVENQYFMGLAYEWVEDSQTLCNHTIPAEIVAKIVAKIKVSDCRQYYGKRLSPRLG